jgi:periplasmic protein TonB
MPRDLFAGTFDRKAGPRRSKWTIAGSFLAHIFLLVGLLVFPVLSAFDNYVVQARSVSFIVPPAPVMPAMPAAPPKSAAPAPSKVAAPIAPPQNPVTEEPTVNAGPPAPPGAPPGVIGKSSIPGTGRSVFTGLPDPPPPAVVKPMPVGGNIKAPTRLSYADPVYPQIAIAAKIDGMVILEATIDETGVVRDVKVLRSIPMLDQAAMDAVKRWRYTPTRLNGVAVPILLTVTVTFALRAPLE